MQELSVITMGGVPQTRSAEPHGHSYIRAPYGVFATSDGFIALAFPELARLGEVIGEASFLPMTEDDAWARRDEVFTKTAAGLAKGTTAHWLETLLAADIWCGPVYDYQALVDDEQIAHNGTFVEYDHPTEGHVKTPGFPYRFSVTPPRVERGAPLTGEHTREVLAELGIDDETVERLLAEGAIAAEPIA